MSSRRRRFFIILLSAIMPLAAFAQQEGFGLAQVTSLTKLGVDEQSVVAAINGAPKVSFDTSVDGIIAMKQAGLSDRMIAAVIARSANNAPTNANFTPANGNSNNQLIAVQGGQTILLKNNSLSSMFAQSKNGNSKDALKSVGIGAASYGGAAVGYSGVLGSAAGMGAGMAGPVISLIGIHRTKTLKGFYFELIPQTTSTVVLTTAATEFTIPLTVFNDGRYPVAEPVLLKLTASEDTRTRVAGTAKAEMKYSDLKGPQEPRATEPYQHETVQAEVTKANNIATIKTAGLPLGEYAIAFVLDGKLLPEVLDFTVRQ
ncbi:MAG: hypothetical protein Q8N81_03795 [bacterium]|nr:hypothetical protein [bacterium]